MATTKDSESEQKLGEAGEALGLGVPISIQERQKIRIWQNSQRWVYRPIKVRQNDPTVHARIHTHTLDSLLPNPRSVKDLNPAARLAREKPCGENWLSDFIPGHWKVVIF